MNTWAYLDLGVVVAIAKLGTSYFHSSPAGVQIVVHYLVNPGKYVSQEKGKKTCNTDHQIFGNFATITLPLIKGI